MSGAAGARAVVVGEALVDILVDGRDDGRDDGRVDGGSRGRVETARHPGGSCANVAVALARLGRPTTLVTELGTDELGREVRAHLAASGVMVVAQERSRTATARAVLDATGAATYAFDLAWSLDPDAVQLLEQASAPAVVHVGSIAGVLEPGASAVRSLVRRWRPAAHISYDVNARPALTPDAASTRTSVEQMVALSDLVKASDEDVAFLYPQHTVAEVAERWLELGAVAVAVTRGSDGAVGHTRDGRVDVAAPRVRVADTIGAGDTFSAGLLDALWDLLAADRSGEDLRGLTPERWRSALAHAARAAAVTVTRAGAEPPWRDELPEATGAAVNRDPS